MSERVTRSVAVIGGGITGLAAAWTLLEQSPGVDVTVFEASSRLGGKVRTVPIAGGRVEAGPDSWLARDPLLERLSARLGLADDLVEPDVFGAPLWIDGKLRRFPPRSFWGVPVGLRSIFASPLTTPGRLRTLTDLLSLRPLSGDDVAVADFVSRRFGSEVLERLIDPLLAGTRAGSTHDMSLAAALPQVDTVARRYRSVMSGVKKERRRGSQQVGPPRFLGIKGGMERLVDALAARLHGRADLVTGSRVVRLESSGTGYELTLSSGGTGSFDAAIVCLPAPQAATVVQSLSSDASRLLSAIEYAPSLSIALVYPPDSFAPPADTSGVLLPRRSDTTVSACTWWTTKWSDAVVDRQVVRCFVGRSSDDVLEMDDDALAAACSRDVANLLGTKTRPEEHHVTRWQEGLPEYRVGHLGLVNSIERALGPHPRVALAGASYRGSGLPDCVAQAERAANRVLTVDLSDLSHRADHRPE